ncbi:MAG: DUF4886 domain-containing protein [Clostridia bacterium]|nr:DUF4886 domain-containing protein [Clostridia bacterium]
MPNSHSPLRILAVGNSFSQDSVEYLPALLRSAGIPCVVGDLYNPGCTMQRHVESAAAGKGIYNYLKNTGCEWTDRPETPLSFALADEDWDIITIQEASRLTGFPESFGEWLSPLLDLVTAAHPRARIGWNMTWAYQSDSPNSHFPSYGRDQTRMYEMICARVKEFILPEKRISFVIPVGTAVQNARSSFLGDTLTRDGSHLSLGFGRFLASLTWACAVSGLAPERFDFNPLPDRITEDMLRVARESVADALAGPFRVTLRQL